MTYGLRCPTCHKHPARCFCNKKTYVIITELLENHRKEITDMKQNCTHYHTCRKPVVKCNSKCFLGKFKYDPCEGCNEAPVDCKGAEKCDKIRKGPQK